MPDWKDVHGWFTEEDAIAYRRMVSDVPNDSRIVELGCYCGRSLASIADLIKEKNLSVTVIDRFDSSAHQDYLPNIRERFDITRHAFGLLSYVDVIKGDSTCLTPSERVALVFIDTSHDYETTMKELEHWACLVDDGGWLCGHDWGGGVEKAFVEYFGYGGVGQGGGMWGIKK